jgi:hypothetical protein
MDRSQIEELIAAFVASARTLREAGFSGAELHGAHGYLITQFLSPWSNSRDDDYGGDRIGRMRFLTKIISGIREVCGDDFILGLKMPADEGVAGGIDLAEARAITEILAAEGRLDLIAYSQGNFSLSLERHLPDMHFPSGPYLDLARSLKPVAGAMAVMALGRVTSPAQGEQVLVAGGGDLIGLSRPLIADPEMPAKTAAGREDDTRPCIHCNFCWGELVAGRAIACQQNVRLGTGDESAPEFEPPARPRRIAVVGAGLAGLEAAWLAAARGHQVVLYGASAEVGGKAGLEARLPGHEQAGLAIEFQKRRLQRHGVEERLGRPVDAETILAGDPDAVVLATGATMQAPELEPGGTAMVAATEALADLLAPAAREEGTAVLFDQDQTAPVYAVAALLARRYAKVVIATPATQLARNVPHVNAIGVHRRLFAAGIETVLGCRPASWHGGRLDLINLYTGERKSIDSVARAIYATPRRANDALAAPLAAAGVPVHLIGDSFAPRNALAAMGEARTTALAL